nr:hypothetical protein CFP56_13331 [Quercus suber]
MLWWYRAICGSVVGTEPAGSVPALLCITGVPIKLALTVAATVIDGVVVDVVGLAEVLEVVFFEVLDVVFLLVDDVDFLVEVLVVAFLLDEVVVAFFDVTVELDTATVVAGVEPDTAALAPTVRARVFVPAIVAANELVDTAAEMMS